MAGTRWVCCDGWICRLPDFGPWALLFDSDDGLLIMRRRSLIVVSVCRLVVWSRWLVDGSVHGLVNGDVSRSLDVSFAGSLFVIVASPSALAFDRWCCAHRDCWHRWLCLVDGCVDVSRALVASRTVGAPCERCWARFVLTMVSPNHRIISAVC